MVVPLAKLKLLLQLAENKEFENSYMECIGNYSPRK